MKSRTMVQQVHILKSIVVQLNMMTMKEFTIQIVKWVVLFLQMSVPKKKNKLLKMPSLSNHNLMIALLAVSLEMNSMCSS